MHVAFISICLIAQILIRLDPPSKGYETYTEKNLFVNLVLDFVIKLINCRAMYSSNLSETSHYRFKSLHKILIAFSFVLVWPKQRKTKIAEMNLGEVVLLCDLTTFAD